MTVKALLKEIRRLRADELPLVVAELDRLSASQAMTKSRTEPTLTKHSNVQWPDRTARRREIFGDAALPNLVLEEREQSRW